MYDSTQPEQIPVHHAVALYADGPYAASPAQARHTTKWIDINAANPKADVLDIEPQDATPQMAATWAAQHITETGRPAVLYTNLGHWWEVKASIATLPVWQQEKVQYWIADPTGVPHIVPGSSATQWYWGQGYDISSAVGGF